MTINLWFTNTKDEEKSETLKFLQDRGALDIKVEMGEDGYEYTALMYVDCDEDVKKALDVMLYYNDRTVKDLNEHEPKFPDKKCGDSPQVAR